MDRVIGSNPLKVPESWPDVKGTRFNEENQVPDSNI